MAVDETSFMWKDYTQRRIAERSLFIPFDMGMEFVGNMSGSDLVKIVSESTKGRPLTD